MAKFQGQLPIRVRPYLGEETDHYLHRLARANHLKPSYLNSLTSPKSRHGKPNITLLAQLAGRPAAGLRRALVDAPGKTYTQPPAEQSATTDVADFRRGVSLLLATVNLREGAPLRLAAQRHGLHPKALLQAVQQQEPRRLSRSVPRSEATRRLIRGMASDGLSTSEIWDRMIDDHDTPLTYASINTFLSRAGRPTTRR
ncbi:hypothetical protein [Kitasatospora sp. NPDC098663]|uniref:hypothetical protein n=1 Tax=Kitasatospora sp. NPDC098663 TaxID=3364096 RepID=UPI00382F0325